MYKQFRKKLGMLLYGLHTGFDLKKSSPANRKTQLFILIIIRDTESRELQNK